ncbi:MAG: hypothetical protein WD403_13860, partial [Pirellulales bacterium]
MTAAPARQLRLPTTQGTCMQFRFPAGIAALVLSLSIVPPAPAQQSPEDELKSLVVAEGFDASIFASEPMITNPAAIDLDTQGRVWVAEIQW